MLQRTDRTFRGWPAVMWVVLCVAVMVLVPLSAQVDPEEDDIFTLRTQVDVDVFTTVLSAESSYGAIVAQLASGPCTGIRLVPGPASGGRDYVFEFEFEDRVEMVTNVVRVTYEYDGLTDPAPGAGTLTVESEEGLSLIPAAPIFASVTELEFLIEICSGQRLSRNLKRARVSIAGFSLATETMATGEVVCRLDIYLSRKGRVVGTWAVHAQVLDGPTFGRVYGLR